MYALVVLISLVVCGMGFASEITASNILHVRNGRKPDAGAAIFPGVPVMQILSVLLVWGLNRVHPDLGFHGIIVLFVIFIAFWTPAFIKARRELGNLVKAGDSEQDVGQVSSEAAPAAPPDEAST